MEWALTIALAVLGVGLLASAALQWRRIHRGATKLEKELETELQKLQARWNETHMGGEGEGGYLVHAEAEDEVRAQLRVLETGEPPPPLTRAEVAERRLAYDAEAEYERIASQPQRPPREPVEGVEPLHPTPWDRPTRPPPTEPEEAP